VNTFKGRKMGGTMQKLHTQTRRESSRRVRTKNPPAVLTFFFQLTTRKNGSPGTMKKENDHSFNHIRGITGR